MSFSDAVGQIDQIVQWEQEMANPATLTQTSSTTGTSATSPSDSSSATSASSFADTLAEAQANTEASTATSVLDPSGSTDSTDPTDSTSALLGGGDSQLLTALQSMEASTSTGSTDSTDSADSLDSLSALDSTDSLDDAASTGGSDGTELADLASAAGQSSATTVPTTGATTATTGGITATNSANITDTTNSGATGGQATSSSDPRILAMTEEANGLVGKPYVWGGGHDGWSSTKGYDCSGFVSAVLHAGGYLSSPQDTATLPSAGGMEQGPGQYVTVYDRDTPGQEGHVIISINGQFYESGGEHGSWGGGGGVQEISTPSASYLATFNNVLHPAGL